MDWFRRIDKELVVFDFVVTNPEDFFHHEDEAVRLGARVFRAPSFHIRRVPSLASWWRHTFLEHPDWRIVHGHDALTTSIYLSVARSLGRETIAHSHSSGGHHGIDGLVRAALRFPLRYVPDARIACSQPAAVWMFGPRTNYRVLKNGIDVERFADSQNDRRAIRSGLSLADAFVVGHVGRLVEVKNHLKVLNVLNAILEREPSARLVLVGDGILRSRLEGQVDALGLNDRVSFLGSRDDIPALLSAMDVLLLPSFSEGLPVTVVEVQASGLPCVVSDAVTAEVGLTDLVRFLSLDEPDGTWADATLQMVTTPGHKSRIDELRDAGYDAVEVASELMRLYLSLAAASGSESRGREWRGTS